MKRGINIGTQSVIIDRSDIFQKFCADVRKYPVLTKEEEGKLFELVRTGNDVQQKQALEKLVMGNVRFVISVAKQFANTNNVLDLINEGVFGLIEAIKNFDPKVGVKFYSYAVHFIRRCIISFLVKKEPCVRQTNISKTSIIKATLINSFLQKEHRMPTDEELLELLNQNVDGGLSNKEDVHTLVFKSIDESYMDNDDEADLPVLREVENRRNNVNEFLVKETDEANKFQIKRLLSVCSPLEQEVITLRYGLDDFRAYEIAEVAERVHKTKERVRQLEISALAKMRCEMKK